jgi:pimeloyl-ACP methyl ester carboxylesterase
MSTPIPHWPGEAVSLGDAQVYVRSAPGDGEPAVYVHGLAGAATNWTDLMGELYDVVDGVAVDLPGFGHSPPPSDGDYSLRAHARTVVALIEARARGPVHLFGNSLGGAVATRVAGRRPDLVRTLTLISPALPDLRPRYGSSRILAATVPGLGPWAMRRLAALPPERRVQETLDMTFADPTRMAPERLMDLVAEVRRRDVLDHAMPAVVGSARGIITEFLLRGPGSLWRDAARVTAHTLLLYGREDRIVDPRMAARAGRVFRHARVVMLPDVGHLAQMEKPQVVARAFRAMLADLPTGTL